MLYTVLGAVCMQFLACMFSTQQLASMCSFTEQNGLYRQTGGAQKDPYFVWYTRVYAAALLSYWTMNPQKRQGQRVTSGPLQQSFCTA